MHGIGERLKNIRKERGMSLDELGDKLNIPKGSLSRYENNLSDPSIEAVKKIAKFFNVSIDWLSGITDVREIIDISEPDFTDVKELMSLIKQDNLTARRLINYYEMMKEVFDARERL